ncbi:hypothetical protein V5799_034075 [Amblyomma americanum]|uniref:Signal transduction protein p25 n=1 Tax=Amblyomma americanum TaxID=6943 RepID=A0AAQ4DLH6_AMBAM
MSKLRKSDAVAGRRDSRRMQVLMVEDFDVPPQSAEDDSCRRRDNGASDSDVENCSDVADERPCRSSIDDDVHWPLGVLQEQFQILQERIVDEVRRVMREEFYEMRMSRSGADIPESRRAVTTPAGGRAHVCCRAYAQCMSVSFKRSPLPLGAQMATPPESPAPGSPVPPTSFDGQFKAFAKFGDSKSTGDAITLSNSDKWFKQAKVIDGKKITTTDTGIYFKQVAKTKKALNLKEYQQFLEVIGKNKKVEVEEIKDKLSTCGPPATTRTTPVATGGAVARLTDHTKYTGTHKQRFDEAGKGRGKEGRQDVAADSGYVSGYKDEGNYNKTH